MKQEIKAMYVDVKKCMRVAKKGERSIDELFDKLTKYYVERKIFCEGDGIAVRAAVCSLYLFARYEEKYGLGGNEIYEKILDKLQKFALDESSTRGTVEVLEAFLGKEGLWTSESQSK